LYEKLKCLLGKLAKKLSEELFMKTFSDSLSGYFSEMGRWVLKIENYI